MAGGLTIKSPTLLKIILIIVLLLMAAPLLGALAMMASGSDMMSQMPDMMNGRMTGLATIWIGLILLLIVGAIVSVSRSLGRRGSNERNKAA
jgi:hypothetical protein